MPKVLVTPYLLQEPSGPYYDALRSAGLEVVYPPDPWALFDPSRLKAAIDGIEAVVAGMEPFNRDVLAGSRLRVIARMGVGYDAIDVPAATAQRIAVTITPGTNEVSVAEQTLAMILGVYRGYPSRDREARSGAWRRQPLPRLAGKVLGLVGLGRIGKAVAPRAQALGLRVIATDPFVDAATAHALGVRLVSFDELLGEADIVSLHLPATDETADLIDARALARMKRGAVLVNTARGSLVDEVAVAEALASGHLFAAALDVFKIEPLPADSPLAQLENVLLSPHMGGLDEASVVAMGEMAARSIAELYSGRWPEGRVVNDELRAGWRW